MFLAQGSPARSPSDNDGVAHCLGSRNQFPAVIALPLRAIVDRDCIGAVGSKRKTLDLIEFATEESRRKRQLGVKRGTEIFGGVRVRQVELHSYDSRLAVRVRLDPVVLVVSDQHG